MPIVDNTHLSEKIIQPIYLALIIASGCFMLPIPLRLPPHHIGFSLAIRLFCDNGVSVDDLLKQANMAMYKAKKSGRTTWRIFTGSMTKNRELSAPVNFI
ncbi:MAG: hypothetical protein H0W85_07475 [Methylotenera sp.]|nr:hypothetical protein [Methylotenera sp.]